MLGWAVLPIIAFGVDATLDPARFVTFPIPRRDLIAGLGLAGLVGIPGVATVLGVLVAAFVWWRQPVAVLVALVTGVLAVAVCVVGSRAATTGLAPVLTGRRAREVTGFGMFALLAAVYLGFGRLSTGGVGSEEQVVAGLPASPACSAGRRSASRGPSRPTSRAVRGGRPACALPSSSRHSACSCSPGTVPWPARWCRRRVTTRGRPAACEDSGGSRGPRRRRPGGRRPFAHVLVPRPALRDGGRRGVSWRRSRCGRSGCESRCCSSCRSSP